MNKNVNYKKKIRSSFRLYRNVRNFTDLSEKNPAKCDFCGVINCIASHRIDFRRVSKIDYHLYTPYDWKYRWFVLFRAKFVYTCENCKIIDFFLIVIVLLGDQHDSNWKRVWVDIQFVEDLIRFLKFRKCLSLDESVILAKWLLDISMVLQACYEYSGQLREKCKEWNISQKVLKGSEKCSFLNKTYNRIVLAVSCK